MKTATKEKLEIRHPLNKAHKMDLTKMKTGVGTQHPWINPAFFRGLPMAIRLASRLLWSAATFLLAPPNNLLVRVCVCIYPWTLSASICVRAAVGEHCQQHPELLPFLLF